MKIQVRTEIGNTVYTFDIENQKEMEALHQAAVFGNPPRYCGCCQNKDYFALDSNKDKEGNTYVNIVCKKCLAKAKLGLYKVGGFFWHKFEQYKKEEKSE